MKNYDECFMRRALELAQQGHGYVEPNPMVGAVIIQPDEYESDSLFGINRDGLPKVVGKGFHQRFGGSHAEVEAIRDAGEKARGGTLYVNLEPCSHFGKTPPCTEAIINSGIKRVVYGIPDPFPQVSGHGVDALEKANIEVEGGVLHDECQYLNMPYLTKIIKKRPWITAKWAMTLDGKMATRTGSSYWISSIDSRIRVHRIRATMDAIMIGSKTAMHDDPQLTVRLPEGEEPARVPVRIVFDSGGTLSIFSELALTIKDVPLMLVFGPEAPKEKINFWRSKGADVVVFEYPTHEQRLVALMEYLAEKGMTNVLVEGGGTLLGHLFDLEYLDEVNIFVAPKIIGGKDAIVPVGGLGKEHMKQAVQLFGRKVETVGSDVLITGRVDYTKPIR